MRSSLASCRSLLALGPRNGGGSLCLLMLVALMLGAARSASPSSKAPSAGGGAGGGGGGGAGLSNLTRSHRPVTVSGHSAGGSMAMQHLVAFSSSVVGAAIAAGSPYGCGGLPGGHMPTGRCYFGGTSVAATHRYISKRARWGLIDDPSNLWTSPLVLFHGRNDWIVNRKCMQDVKDQMEGYISPERIVANFRTGAGHCWSTDDGPCSCGFCSSDYCCDVNNCGYDLSGDLLSRAYGPLAPRAPAQQYLHWISQQKFMPPRSWSWAHARLARWALAYVPTGCQSAPSQCKTHVDYHGCVSDNWRSRALWASSLDLNEYGEANDIVILYPQAQGDAETGPGCWNWGFPKDDFFFDTHLSVQLQTVRNMLNNLDMALRLAPRLKVGQGPPERDPWEEEESPHEVEMTIMQPIVDEQVLRDSLQEGEWHDVDEGLVEENPNNEVVV